jgi:hypothetical protein
MNPPALVRQPTVGVVRNRTGSEQYARVLTESGDIRLIDYTRDCRTTLVLKQGTLYPHAFFDPVYYCEGELVLRLQVVDLATGNILPDWKYESSDAPSLTDFGRHVSISLKPGCVYEGQVHIVSPLLGDIGSPILIDR